MQLGDLHKYIDEKSKNEKIVSYSFHENDKHNAIGICFYFNTALNLSTPPQYIGYNNEPERGSIIKKIITETQGKIPHRTEQAEKVIENLFSLSKKNNPEKEISIYFNHKVQEKLGVGEIEIYTFDKADEDKGSETKINSLSIKYTNSAQDIPNERLNIIEKVCILAGVEIPENEQTNKSEKKIEKSKPKNAKSTHQRTDSGHIYHKRDKILKEGIFTHKALLDLGFKDENISSISNGYEYNFDFIIQALYNKKDFLEYSINLGLKPSSFSSIFSASGINIVDAIDSFEKIFPNLKTIYDANKDDGLTLVSLSSILTRAGVNIKEIHDSFERGFPKLKAIYDANKDDGLAWHSIAGIITRAGGDMERVIDDFEKGFPKLKAIYDANKDDGLAWHNISAIFIRSGSNIKSAIDDFAVSFPKLKAIYDANKDDGFAWHNISAILTRSGGDIKRASDDFEKGFPKLKAIYDANKNDGLAWENISALLNNSGINVEKAINQLEKSFPKLNEIYDINKHSGLTWANMSTILARSGVQIERTINDLYDNRQIFSEILTKVKPSALASKLHQKHSNLPAELKKIYIENFGVEQYEAKYGNNKASSVNQNIASAGAPPKPASLYHFAQAV